MEQGSDYCMVSQASNAAAILFTIRSNGFFAGQDDPRHIHWQHFALPRLAFAATGFKLTSKGLELGQKAHSISLPLHAFVACQIVGH